MSQHTLTQLTNSAVDSATPPFYLPPAVDVGVSLNFRRCAKLLSTAARISGITSGPTVTWRTSQLRVGRVRCRWLPLHDSYFLPSAARCALNWLSRRLDDWLDGCPGCSSLCLSLSLSLSLSVGRLFMPPVHRHKSHEWKLVRCMVPSCFVFCYFYASANVVDGGIIFSAFVRPCVRESRTNVVSKLFWVSIDGIWPNFYF